MMMWDINVIENATALTLRQASIWTISAVTALTLHSVCHKHLSIAFIYTIKRSFQIDKQLDIVILCLYKLGEMIQKP